MATPQVLRTYYSNILRVDYAAIPAADATLLNNLAASVDAGTITLAAAIQSVARLAINTTSVATLSYQFFTGSIPFERGIDYLVSPQGANPNNLNAAYYQNFNIENRYINFAVNLGVAGEGQARFADGYGALTLRQAVGKAYGEIFGVAATEAKLNELLDFQVSNGLGGTFSRAEYFAYYGRDGVNGTGTKAAAVGWLMAQAAKENIGTYAEANNAFLADLGPDGFARFHSDLTGAYGTPPAGQIGTTINFAADQSVSTTAPTQALRSTDLDDAITGKAGLNAVNSVKAGGGADTITVTGAVSGFVDGEGGNDVITVDILNASVPVLGGSANGAISGGAGDDRITIGEIKAGSTVDGGAGDDSLTITGLPGAATVRGVEHLYFQGPDSGPGQVATGPGQTFMYPGMSGDLAGVVGLQDVWNVTPGVASLALTNVQAGVTVGVRNNAGGVLVDYAPGVGEVHVHLDNTTDGLTDNFRLNSNNVILRNATGAANIHVDSDSAVRQIFHRDGSTIVIDGLGKLTAESVSIGITTAGFPPFDTPAAAAQRLDASAAAEVHIGGFAPGAMDTTIILSSGNDSIGAYLYGQVRTTFTLGAGADVFRITAASPPAQQTQVPALANLHFTGPTIDTYATITDFQKGVDQIDLGPLIPAVRTDLAPIGFATTLELAAESVSARLAAGATAVFEFKGDTYVYRQDATVGVTNGDGLIKLVGVTGLTVGTGATAADIHYG